MMMAMTEFVPLKRGNRNRFLHACGFIEMTAADFEWVQDHGVCRACKQLGGWELIYVRRPP